MNLFQQHTPSDPESARSRLPVLDLGSFLDGEYGARDRLGEAIAQACLDTGFFYITNHGVPQSLIDDTFAQSRRFHALPLEVKQTLALDSNNTG